MGQDQVAQLVREGLFLVLLVSAPAVVASLIVGVAVSLLQTATQLQDHTLSFVPKLVVVMVTLALAGPWIGAQLLRFTQAVFAAVPTLRW